MGNSPLMGLRGTPSGRDCARARDDCTRAPHMPINTHPPTDRHRCAHPCPPTRRAPAHCLSVACGAVVPIAHLSRAARAWARALRAQGRVSGARLMRWARASPCARSAASLERSRARGATISVRGSKPHAPTCALADGPRLWWAMERMASMRCARRATPRRRWVSAYSAVPRSRLLCSAARCIRGAAVRSTPFCSRHPDDTRRPTPRLCQWHDGITT